jgi:hypothetical protein
LGTPPTPALQADTLTATSLSLDWSTEASALSIEQHEPPLYRVKWRYEDMPGANWQYFRNHSWSTETSAKLENLQPFTKYRVSQSPGAFLLHKNYIDPKNLRKSFEHSGFSLIDANLDINE